MAGRTFVYMDEVELSHILAIDNILLEKGSLAKIQKLNPVPKE